MHILVLHGSPHRNGNSNGLVSHFLRGINSSESTHKQVNHEIHHYYLNELKIEYCRGCLYCATSDHHLCKIQDDMQEIYSDFHRSDLVVIATPMYWGYMTGPMKVVFDRMEALAWNGMYGKEIVVIITYHHHYESTISFFERIAPFFKLKIHYLICCTKHLKNDVDMDSIEVNIDVIPHKAIEAFELGFSLRNL